MKKYFWYTSISLVLVLMLNGCSGGGDTNDAVDSMIPPAVNIGIKKSGNISVSSAEEYLMRYEATDSDTKRTVLIFAGIIQEDIENLENIYVMTFPFEFVGIEIEYPTAFSPAQFLISKCKNRQNITEPQSEIVIQADGGFTYNATLQGLWIKAWLAPPWKDKKIYVSTMVILGIHQVLP